MVTHYDYLDEVRGQYKFTSPAQKLGKLFGFAKTACKKTWGATKWTYKKGQQAYVFTAPIVAKSIENHQKRKEEQEALKKFLEFRQTVSSGVEDATRRLESARTRGWDVTIEDTEDIRIDNYGKYVEVSKDALVGTFQTREGYVIDLAKRVAYGY